jgi:predicted TIM-barrel enzyme
LVLTGKSYAETLQFIATARDKLGAIPILVGGGVTERNFAEVAGVADGVIVSSSLKGTGSAFGKFDPGKVKTFMDVARRVQRPD